MADNVKAPYAVRYSLTGSDVWPLLSGLGLLAMGVFLLSDEPMGGVLIVLGLVVLVVTLLSSWLGHTAIRVDDRGITHMHPLYRRVRYLPWTEIVSLVLTRESRRLAVARPILRVLYRGGAQPPGVHTLRVDATSCRIDEDELRAAIKANAPTDIPVEGTLRG